MTARSKITSSQPNSDQGVRLLEDHPKVSKVIAALDELQGLTKDVDVYRAFAA